MPSDQNPCSIPKSRAILVVNVQQVSIASLFVARVLWDRTTRSRGPAETLEFFFLRFKCMGDGG
jgi:hypothetical protein